MKKKMMQACRWMTGLAIAAAAVFPAGCSQTGSAQPSSSAEEAADFEPFIRIDMDDPEAWSQDLANVRILKEGFYSFIEPSAKYGISDAVPNEEGLKDLCISGSAQFSLPQFYSLAEDLKEAADGRQIWVVDLRRESHVQLGRMSVSWYEWRNYGNDGLTLEEIEKSEIERFAPLIGQTVSAYTTEEDLRADELKMDVQGFLTEKELVESAGFSYYRIPVRDHSWPAPENVDEFIEFVKGLDTDNT